MPKVKGILLEALFTDDYITKGQVYEVIEIEKHEGYDLFWFYADDNKPEFVLTTTKLFNIYYQV